MDTLLCNDDGDIVIGTYDPSNTLLRLSADQYTAGSATWADQSGNALDFTVSTNTSLKGTDADGFPYMDFNGTYGSATRGSNIPAPTSGTYTVFCITQIKASTATWRSLMYGSGDIQLIIQSGSNNLGLYNGGFVDSGFVVTTAMTSSRNLLVVELSQTAPIFKFQLNESGTDSIINSSTGFEIPFNTIGTNGGNYWGNIYEFIVYDGVLSASERDYVAEYLAYKWAITEKLPSFTSTQGVITALQLLDISGIVGWYLPENWTGTQWTDASGAGNHATAVEGTINYAMHDGSSVGAQRTFPVLYGGTTAEINFPSAILPTSYTLIALTSIMELPGQEFWTLKTITGFLDIGVVVRALRITWVGLQTRPIATAQNGFWVQIKTVFTDQNPRVLHGSKVPVVVVQVQICVWELWVMNQVIGCARSSLFIIGYCHRVNILCWRVTCNLSTVLNNFFQHGRHHVNNLYFMDISHSI